MNILYIFFALSTKLIYSIIPKATAPWRFAMFLIIFLGATDILFLYWGIYLKFYPANDIAKKVFGFFSFAFLIFNYLDLLYKEKYVNILARYENEKFHFIYYLLFVLFISTSILLTLEYLKS